MEEIFDFPGHFTGDEREKKSAVFAGLLAEYGLVDPCEINTAAHMLQAFCDQGPLPEFCLYFRSDTGIPDWTDVALWGFSGQRGPNEEWINHNNQVGKVCNKLFKSGGLRKIGPEKDSTMERIYLSGCLALILNLL